MDSIWTQLPLDLVDHVCNQLPKVRRMDPDLKVDLRFWHLEKLLRNNQMWYGRVDGLQLLLDDLNMLNETDHIDVHDAWFDMDLDRRMEYYDSVMR
jgi:hypothetical protein